MKCYMVQRLMTEQPLATIPLKVRLDDPEAGCMGALFVFRSKAAARAIFGPDVELLQMEADYAAGRRREKELSARKGVK